MEQRQSTINFSRVNDKLVSSSYKYTKMLPQSGLTSYSFTSSGNQFIQFYFNSNSTFNFSDSFLHYLLTFTAASGSPKGYNWSYCELPFQTVQLSTIGGVKLYENQVNCARLRAKLAKYLKGPEDYLNKPVPIDLNNASKLTQFDGYAPANTAVNVNYIAETDTIDDDYSYNNIKYLITPVGALARKVNCDIKFSDFIPKSVFDKLKKSIYWSEQLVLTLNLAPLNAIAFAGNSNTDPTVSVAASDGCDISELSVYVAVEQNPDIVNDLRDVVMNQGIKMTVPYQWVFTKANPSGTQGSVQIDITRSMGRRLMGLCFWCQSSSDSDANYYSSGTTNGSEAMNGTVQRLVSFRTYLNNNILNSDETITLASNLDYSILSPSLQGTMISTRSRHLANYVWWETQLLQGGDSLKDWCDREGANGLEIPASGLQYSIQATNASLALTWYVAVWTDQTLIVDRAGVRMSVE